MAKVRIASSDRFGQKGPLVSFDLEPTTHSKGGEAWAVSRDGAALGLLRRWTEETLSIRASGRSATIRKLHRTNWAVYAPTGECLGVHDTRTAALRALLEVSRG